MRTPISESPIEGKTCSRCGAVKPLSAFHMSAKGGKRRQGWCKPCQLEAKADVARSDPERAALIRRAHYVRTGGYSGKVKRLSAIDKGKIAFREAVAGGKAFARSWWLLALPASQSIVIEVMVRSGGAADLDSLLALYPSLPNRADRHAKLMQAIFLLRRRLTYTGFTIALVDHRQGYRIERVPEDLGS